VPSLTGCARRRERAPRVRAGFTLPELAVALALTMLLAAAMLALLRGQERFYRRSALALDARGQLRQGAALLAAELRALSPEAGDITRALPDTLELRATLGAAVTCDRGSDWLALPELSRAGYLALAAWLDRPRAGDTAWVLDAGRALGDSSAWRPHTVARLDRDGSLCTGGPFATSAGESAHRLTLAEPVDSALAPFGVAVRFTRQVRHALYRGHDGTWQLGSDDRSPAGWTGIQPVSGPYGGGGTPGLEFRYVDSGGATLAPPAQGTRVRRIDAVLRARPARAPAAPAVPDSLELSISPRNER
jgi:hypothetical protein